jgi:cell wall-associated NlpC family hydrolase
MSALTFEAVADIEYRAGFRGDGLITAVAVIFAESGGDPSRVGHNSDAHVNPTGQNTIDRGLWQLNSYWHREVSDAAAYDADAASREAYRITGGGRDFKQWYGFTKGGYRTHLEEARRAAAGAAGRAGGPGGSVSPPPDASPTIGNNPKPNGAGTKVRKLRSPVPLPYGTPDALPVDSLPLTLADIRIVGRGVTEGSAPLSSRLLHAGVDLTLKEIPQLTLVFSDPGLELYSQSLITGGQIVFAGDLIMMVDAIELGEGSAGETVTATCRERAAILLKRARDMGPSGDLSPSEVARTWFDLFTGNGAIRSMVIEDSPVRPGLKKAVDENDPAGRLESTWAQLSRYADEMGFLFNIVGGVAYFARPSFIAGRSTGYVVRYRPGNPDTADPFGAMSMPTCRRTGNPDAAGLANLTVDAVRHLGEALEALRTGSSAPIGGGLETIDEVRLPQRRASKVRPGYRLELHGIPSFDGSYLTTKVSGDIDEDNSAWLIAGEKPQDPPPSLKDGDAALPGAAVPGSVATPARAGSKSAADFTTFCEQQAGKRYVYGAEVRLDDPNPTAFDCSELVQWGCARVGVVFPDGSGAQYAACKRAGTLISVADAAKTRGALLFRGPGGSEHVAVSRGNGKETIEARGSAYGVMVAPVEGRFTAAGLIPGMDYSGGSDAAGESAARRAYNQQVPS